MSGETSTRVPVTKRSLSYWVRTSDMRLQATLVATIVVTVFARVLPLEFQKKIINLAINFKRTDLLLLYSGLFLGAVLLASGLKMVINTIQTWLGQKALSVLRKEIFHHILTLPINFYRKTQPGMVVSSLVTEVAPVGDFVGQAVAMPLSNILTLIAFGGYLFYLNWIMALITMAIYPLVILVIPRLQRRTNYWNKLRVNETRQLSSKIGESITGIHEIHGNGAYRLENWKFDTMVDSLQKVRVIWNIYKLGTKTFNNFAVNLAPFLLFLVGGYLIIQGRFDLGSLVAFLSAQEKLYDPWKELMDFWQVYQDASVSYEKTMEYFDELPEHTIEVEGREPMALPGRIEIENLSFVVGGSIRLLNGVSLSLEPGEHLALVGFSGSGKSTLALCIGQLYKYTSGSLRIGGQEVEELSKEDIAHTVGFVSQSPFIFEGSIQENLLYSCQAIQHDPGKVDPAALPSRDDQISMLQQTGMFVDVLRFGLNTILAGDDAGGLPERIIRVRAEFQREHGRELGEYVEFFDEDTYLLHSTVAANIIFGNPNVPEFRPENLSANPVFLAFLDEAQLTRPLLALGAEMTSVTVDILGALAKDPVLFEQSPIPMEDFDEYAELARRLKKERIHDLTDPERKRLLELALAFVPGRHKVVGLSTILQNMVLEGRSLFKRKIEEALPGAIAFYNPLEYIHNQTVLDNILFGKPTSDAPPVQEKINQAIIQLLIAEDLLEGIVEIGMSYQVGSKGDKLSGGQRQKLAIARVFLKEPRILIMDEATSALDNKSQARIQNVLETRWKGKSTLIAVVHRLDIIKNFDKVAVMKAGKIVEYGTYDDLMAKKGNLYELVHGKK